MQNCKSLKSETPLVFSILGVLSVLTGAAFVAHLVCCSWYYIGGDGGWHASMDPTWMPHGEQTFGGGDGHDVTAIANSTIATALKTRYWRTMFFAVGILVGSERGDITPTSGWEMGFIIIIERIWDANNVM